jgi:hypothetical protein
MRRRRCGLIAGCWSCGPPCRAGPHRAWGTARPLCRTSRLALLLAFAAISPLGIALGQTAPGSPIVSDLPVASGTERVLFLGAQGARALVVLLPGSDGIIGLDSGGGVHQFGGNFLVRTIGQWVAQGFDVVLPDAPNGTSLLGQRHLLYVKGCCRCSNPTSACAAARETDSPLERDGFEPSVPPQDGYFGGTRRLSRREPIDEVSEPSLSRDCGRDAHYWAPPAVG